MCYSISLEKDDYRDLIKEFTSGDEFIEQQHTLFIPEKDYLFSWNFGQITGEYTCASHIDVESSKT